MASTDFLPHNDEALLPWFTNFQTKLPTHAANVGLTAGDVASSGRDLQTLRFALELVRIFRAETQERTTFKNTLRDGPKGINAPPIPTVPVVAPPTEIASPGIVPRLRALVQRIKTHPGYNASVGQDLGVVAPQSGLGASERDAAKPTAKGGALPGGAVEIRWRKRGFTGVIVETQRGDEAVWSRLGIDLYSPFRDDRALVQTGIPEIRRYRLRYLVADMPVGLFSDTLVVTASP